MDREPNIDPKYSGVTIPPNIAPMNFVINEDGNFFQVNATSSSGNLQLLITSSNRSVRFPRKAWKKLLKENKGGKIKIQISSTAKNEKTLKMYKPVFMFVANEKIDPYLIYRSLYPGYHSWYKMKIIQRSLEKFQEKPLIDNQIIENNCVNCHAFNQNNPDKFLVHIRGSRGGTYFIEDDKITKTALKTDSMPGDATYPSWHPDGRYVAFSSNQVMQSFYAHPSKIIEVYDCASMLVLYDINNNEMFYIKDSDSTSYMYTFPTWSPNGKYLYFCRAKQAEKDINSENIKHIHYDLARKMFYPEFKSFGETEIVFDAREREKSVSLPRISPDGQYLVFTLHDYGTFPIWHKEADLYLLNLQNRKHMRMKLNSDETESYHSWSSNGKWLVFSSKRRDGRSARPYFAYFGSHENIGRPFVLPQKDPTRYNRMLKTFNLPEFVTDRIRINPRDFARVSNKKSLKSVTGDKEDFPLKCMGSILEKKVAKTE